MNKKGFTLVELMVVIVIIGILAAVAAPKLSDNINSARCNEVPKTFKKIMDKAVEYEAVQGEWPTGFGTGGASAREIDVKAGTNFWAYTMENSSDGFTTSTGTAAEFQVVATSQVDIGKVDAGAVVAVDNGGDVYYASTAHANLADKYMSAYLKNASSF